MKYDFTLEHSNQNSHSEKQNVKDNNDALFNTLFSKYQKKVKPNGMVYIKFALVIEQIVEMVAKDELLVLDAWINQEWSDSRLSWNPASFNNVASIQISSDILWTPDTFMDSSSERNSLLIPHLGTYLMLQHDGHISWPHPMKAMKMKCPMNVRMFPYDQQKCLLIFSSWTHTSKYLNYTLKNETLSLEEYKDGDTWLRFFF
jgi:nicotinic acetylcholine receptor